MQLHQLTEKMIKQFAGSTIFGRGHEYFVNNMVLDLNYNADTETIEAEVAGNYGEYEVTVTTAGEHLSAACSCPYEGYPCKHVVAVLLTFLHNQEDYMSQAKKRKKTESSLAQKIKELSKDELVEMLLSYSKKYPDVKRDLMVRLESDKKATFDSIQKQINKAFPSVPSHNYSTAHIAKQLRAILKSVENSPQEMQIKVYWAVIDRTLHELNDYGMDDEILEGVAIDTMEALVVAFAEAEAQHAERAEIIEQLMDYYNWGNCGLVDWTYDTVMQLCATKADYQIVIQKLEAKLKKASFKSYYQDLLADLYAKVGDPSAQLKILESHLQYGTDYWRLAEYWFEHGDAEKAWQIVHEGIEKGEGRKTELYAALQKQYQKRKEYDRIFELLQQKVAKNDLDHGRNFKLDSTYQYLREHYKKLGNYEGQIKLLELRLLNNDIDLDFYKEAEKTLNVSDWQTFETKILNALRQRIEEQQQQRKKFGWYYAPLHASTEVSVLAGIYFHKSDVVNLFETVKENIELLQQYESLLLPHYTEQYLEKYRAQIERLIAARGRNNYQTAVPYAKAIKRIYTTVLKQPDTWMQYLTRLRAEHKTLRAFQEEFARL